MLRGWACTALGLLCEKITGRVATSNTSRTVRWPVCDSTPASHAFHLGDHLAAERRQAAVVVLAAATDRVVAVVGQQHPAHTQSRGTARSGSTGRRSRSRLRCRNPPRAARRPSRVRCRRPSRPARSLRACAISQWRMPASVRKCVLDALVAEADVDHRRVHTRRAIALQLRQERGVVRPAHRHAAVVVPHQASSSRARAAARSVGAWVVVSMAGD